MENRTLTNSKSQQIIKDADTAFNDPERHANVTTWNRIARFVLQTSDGSFNTEYRNKGSLTHQDCYDSTAPNACRDLAAALHSTITNPQMQWAKMRMRDEKLNNNSQVMTWLDDTMKVFHQAVNESNFDTQIGIGYNSYIGFATLIFMLEEEFGEQGEFKGFNHSAWFIGEVAYCENHLGRVNKIYRKFKMTVDQAMTKFKDQADYIRELKKLKPSEELTFIHAIYERKKEEYKLNSVGLASPEKRPIASCYVDLKTGKLVEEGGYYELPVYVARINTRPGEKYGFGPAHIAMPDILSMNKIRKSYLRGLAQAVNPAKITTDRNIVSGKFDEGQIVTVRNVNDIQELGTKSNFAVAKDTIEDYRNSINKVFYIDKLLLPPRNETGQMTAYEVDQRLQQMQQILGPLASRLGSEFQEPYVLRGLKILLRNGKLPPLPDVLKGLNPDFDITFVNSLARSQQVSEIRNINSWLQEEITKAQIRPEELDLIDLDAVMYYTARLRDIPESFLRPVEQVKQMRDQRQKQMEAQQMLNAGEQLSNMAQKTKPGAA